MNKKTNVVLSDVYSGGCKVAAVFDDVEDAKKYAEKFVGSYYDVVEDVEVNPLIDILHTDKKPYCVYFNERSEIFKCVLKKNKFTENGFISFEQLDEDTFDFTKVLKCNVFSKDINDAMNIANEIVLNHLSKFHWGEKQVKRSDSAGDL